jgi:hypothetical protein
MKFDDILKIINNNDDMNYNDIHDDIYKEQQQSYSLMKHDAVQIIYQPKTDEDIIKLDNGSDDITYGSGIYKDDVHLNGSITFFMKNISNNHHYAITANYGINKLDKISISMC